MFICVPILCQLLKATTDFSVQSLEPTEFKNKLNVNFSCQNFSSSIKLFVVCRLTNNEHAATYCGGVTFSTLPHMSLKVDNLCHFPGNFRSATTYEKLYMEMRVKTRNQLNDCNKNKKLC